MLLEVLHVLAGSGFYATRRLPPSISSSSSRKVQASGTSVMLADS